MTDMLSTLLWNDFLKTEEAIAPAGSSHEPLDGRQLQLLSSVRVEMSVEISRISLSLGEVLELSRGSRLELQLEEELPVTLSIDSVPIAKGRIVYDGDEPAVEIIEIFEEGRIQETTSQE